MHTNVVQLCLLFVACHSCGEKRLTLRTLLSKSRRCWSTNCGNEWTRLSKKKGISSHHTHTHTHTHTQPTPPTVLISSIAHCLPLTVLVEMYFYGGKVFIDMWGLIGRLEGATTDNCSPDLEHVLDKFLH